MLTQTQQAHVDAVPEDKVFRVVPYDPQVRMVMRDLLQKIRSISTHLHVVFLGSSYLGIAGEGDLDIDILCSAENFQQYVSQFTDEFGTPARVGDMYAQWKFMYEGCWVDLYLTESGAPAVAELIEIYRRIKENKKLREQYEEMKYSLNGQPYRVYQAQKYEFHNRILGLH